MDCIYYDSWDGNEMCHHIKCPDDPKCPCEYMESKDDENQT